jgi:hypothetical protein
VRERATEARQNDLSGWHLHAFDGKLSMGWIEVTESRA